MPTRTRKSDPPVPVDQHAALVLPPNMLRVIQERHAWLRSPEVAGGHLAQLVRDRLASALQKAVYWAVGKHRNFPMYRRPKVIRLNDTHSLVVEMGGYRDLGLHGSSGTFDVSVSGRHERDPPAATLAISQEERGWWDVRVERVRGRRSSKLAVFKPALEQALRVYRQDPLPAPPLLPLIPGSLMFGRGALPLPTHRRRRR